MNDTHKVAKLIAAARAEALEEAAKLDLRLAIQKRIQDIPASNPGYIEADQTTLRDQLSRRLIERIADEAAQAVSAAIRSLSQHIGERK